MSKGAQRCGKRETSPISATKIDAITGPTPLIACTADSRHAPKAPGDRALDHGEFAPVDLQEIAQRGDPDGIRAFEGHLVESF